MKIADMGLARVTQHQVYIKKSEGGVLPVRWMAPETLATDGFYSEASDVWAYGVCIWEVFSDGAIPYEFIDVSVHCVSFAHVHSYFFVYIF